MATTIKGKVARGLMVAGAAAAAGYYFYGSNKASQHRKIAAKWAGEMKNEVIRESRRLKDINAKDFGKVVDTVADTYKGVRSISPADLKKAASELKVNWETVGAEIQKAGRKNVNTVKKIAKKVVAKGRKNS